MVFKFGEFFCGPGGIGLGASQAGFLHDNEEFAIIHEWASDYDKDTCETYKNNLCQIHGRVIHKDVRKINIDKLSAIDAFAFGFPCNDFSVIGEKKGMDGAYGPLYTYGVKVLKKFKPKWFLAENVGGLKTNNDGKAFKKILEDLIECGYNLYPHLYKFDEYGVPQSRQRIIIVGIRNDFKFKFKIPFIKNLAKITARDAIENPPIPFDAPNNERTNQSQQVINRLSYIKPGENAFTADIPEELQLKVKNVKISQIYKRLDPEKPSYTVTGSGGGGTHIYHWKENRSLTNRERARLQTFPDNFIFYGSKESVRKQIGMAVPVLGAKIIINAILKTFAGIDYDYTKQNIELNEFIN